jgi:hypothetical protein
MDKVRSDRGAWRSLVAADRAKGGKLPSPMHWSGRATLFFALAASAVLWSLIIAGLSVIARSFG